MFKGKRKDGGNILSGAETCLRAFSHLGAFHAQFAGQSRRLWKRFSSSTSCRFMQRLQRFGKAVSCSHAAQTRCWLGFELVRCQSESIHCMASSHLGRLFPRTRPFSWWFVVGRCPRFCWNARENLIFRRAKTLYIFENMTDSLGPLCRRHPFHCRGSASLGC